MKTVKNMEKNFQCYLENEPPIIIDTTEESGGTGEGMKPFELVETALAACMNITARRNAGQVNIELHDIKTFVRMNWQEEGKLIFEYDYSIPENFTDIERRVIDDAINSCALRQLFSTCKIEFKQVAIK
ncbi:OsmC family protein [Sporomusa acidovorans]|uniref:OsmC-like protein n=2 Tax=Sporomusa TaxID=2375 RepID=A0ABZ3J725_SPOA4|nr:OsmC family protein [Sporomusa acidovorans]OZC18504.1 OsmC-like protein [Sporomusa acidovorans DSM 3132]SDE36807.1 putative redox protein [Sporomusa acidovorans]